MAENEKIKNEELEEKEEISIKDLNNEIEKLKKENEKYYEHLQRTAAEFDNYKKSKHGISAYCKVCRSENYKLLRQKKCFAEIDALIEKSKENEKTKEEVFGKKRRSCSVCGITKDIDEFNWSIKYKSLRSQCRKCQSEYKKKWELKRIEERGY